MFLESAEMNVKFVEMLQKCSKRRSFGHLCKSVDILGKTLAAIAELSVRTRNICVSVVDIAGKKDSRMHITPVSTHLLTIFATSVEIGYLVGSEHIVHILGKLGLKRGHNGELFAHKNFGEQLLCAGENHCLLFEVLDMRALGKKFRHIVYLMASLTTEHLAGAGENGGADKNRHIGEFGDELLHQCQILRTIIFGGHMYLQKSNVNIAQIVVVSFWRIADKKFALGVVVLQPILQGSAYEAASNNSNVNHNFYY